VQVPEPSLKFLTVGAETRICAQAQISSQHLNSIMAAQMKTVLVNDTPFQIRVYSSTYYPKEELRLLSVIPVGGKWTYHVDPNATYIEYVVQSSLDNFMSKLDVCISSDDEFEEVRVICPENVFSLVRIPRSDGPRSVSFSRPTFTKCTAGIVIVKIRLQASHLVAQSCQDFKAAFPNSLISHLSNGLLYFYHSRADTKLL
jgi:hypothetical protein